MLLRLLVTAELLTSRSWASEQLYVAPGGSDDAPGTRLRPLGSLEGARNALRRLRQRAGAGAVAGATAWLLAGEYQLQNTFTLDEQDSGEDGEPVTYRAVPGARVVISGGIQVSDWKLVFDKAYISKLPLGSSAKVWEAGIPLNYLSQIAEPAAHGMMRPVISGSEFFFGGQPMTMARWPNTGWTYTDREQPTTRYDQFRYAEPHISDWAGASDAWVRGYWRWSWADDSEKLTTIDPHNALVTTGQPYPKYGYAGNRPFFGFNLLSELDQPGEYYIDRTLGNVLFLPPGGSLEASAYISLLRGPLIRIDGASYIVLQDLTLSYGRGAGVIISGGRSDVVSHCQIKNLGGAGVRIDGGFGHTVVNSELAELGAEGVTLSGGNRKTLNPGGNIARDNHIHSYARLTRTYCPAIALVGVGNVAIHNLIHDAPHQAISIHGNDHIIEYNEIYRVAMETQDVGAIYIGRDWTERGNRIRHNYVHDLGAGDVTAVYLDDQASGSIVEDNYFVRVPRGVLIGGGRDNTVRRNVFLDVGTAVHVDARGLRSDPQIKATLIDRYVAVPCDSPPYSTRYPQLVDMFKHQPQSPIGNVISGNVYTAANWLDLSDGLKPNDIGVEDNTYLPSLRFDPARKTLTDASVSSREGVPQFVAVDLNTIGSRIDTFPDWFNWFNGSGVLNIAFDGPVVETRGAVGMHTAVNVVRLRLWNVGAAPLQGAVNLWAYPRGQVDLSVRRLTYSLRPDEVERRSVDVVCSPGLPEAIVGYQEENADDIPQPLHVRCVQQ
ncbi:MAG: right-handed parallel beta-helix repeat-containing protein [Bryobacteraceae bacterium]